MNTNILNVCAILLLTIQTMDLGQKTEIRVRQGKVKVVTETPALREVSVDAGRKVALAPDKNPAVTVDDPLVDDVMETKQPVLITRRGEPVAQIVPYIEPRSDTSTYPLRNMNIEIAEDFDDELPGLWDALA